MVTAAVIGVASIGLVSLSNYAFDMRGRQSVRVKAVKFLENGIQKRIQVATNAANPPKIVFQPISPSAHDGFSKCVYEQIEDKGKTFFLLSVIQQSDSTTARNDCLTLMDTLLDEPKIFWPGTGTAQQGTMLDFVFPEISSVTANVRGRILYTTVLYPYKGTSGGKWYYKTVRRKTVVPEEY